MNKLTYTDIRKKYLDFMKKNGHVEIPSASLVPENDPTLLFTSAGMAPLVPFLLGEKHPSGTRLTNVQRCIRTIDIDEVGDLQHCTSFEMLGNWSLNDYFKEEAINFTLNFFLDVMGFEMDNIYASVFEGNEDAPQDNDAIEIWKEIFSKHGIDAKVGKGGRIYPYPKKENWWELEAGGPCGPCSEIFFDTGREECGPNCEPRCACGKYIELGNNVFMEYLKKDGKYSKMDRHNVDFGGGLDRYTMISQEVESVFDTDIYKPILDKVKSLSKEENIKSQRVVVDHIKAATWMIMDGVTPGRTEQSYVLRRVLRKAIRHARQLGINTNFTREIGQIAIEQFSDIWTQLNKQKNEILDVMEEEETKFRKTLRDGIKKFESLVSEKSKITGEDAFFLYETYGFPIEITQEMAQEKGLEVNIKDYEKAYENHQKKSREAAKGFFKGGLADTSEMSKKYHTSTHLLNAALKQVLGEHVYQKGSNINPERVRFDFAHGEKLTDEELKKVEELVNDAISQKLPVEFREMPKAEALKLVPDAVFTEKYGDKVKVYFIGKEPDYFSKEICGGPHVDNTQELGKFRIIKQESVGAGVRRIKATLSR